MTTTNIPATAHRVVHKILADGGATESIVIGVSTPGSGYVVSFREHERKVKVSTDGTLAQHRARLLDQVAGYAFQKAFVLTKPGHYLGAWIDGDTLYLDVSEVIADLPTAVKRAIERDQLAIFSLTTHKEVQTKPGRVNVLHAEQAAAWEIMRELGKGSASIDASGAPAFERNTESSSPFEVVAEGHYVAGIGFVSGPVMGGPTPVTTDSLRGLAPTSDQRELLIALHNLSGVIERVIPDSTSHYAINGLRELLGNLTDPKHRAYAGAIVTNDVKAARD